MDGVKWTFFSPCKQSGTVQWLPVFIKSIMSIEVEKNVPNDK